MSDEESYETISIIALGAQQVGKSCILTRMIANNFTSLYDPTYHQDEYCISVQVNDLQTGKPTTLRVKIVDTSGDEEQHDEAKKHVLDRITEMDGYLLIYDICDFKTFDSLLSYYQPLLLLYSMKQYLSDDVTLSPSMKQYLLIGNKLDLIEENPTKRELTKQNGELFARNFFTSIQGQIRNTFTNSSNKGIDLIETSAKTAEYTELHEIWVNFCQDCYNKKQLRKHLINLDTLSRKTTGKKSSRNSLGNRKNESSSAAADCFIEKPIVSSQILEAERGNRNSLKLSLGVLTTPILDSTSKSPRNNSTGDSSQKSSPRNEPRRESGYSITSDDSISSEITESKEDQQQQQPEVMKKKSSFLSLFSKKNKVK